MKARFIYRDEKSHKFWDIETNGTDLTVQYGKVGTTGQSQTKQFASEEECKKAA
jgi:predicted DNA-binding WGR domain protein